MKGNADSVFVPDDKARSGDVKVSDDNKQQNQFRYKFTPEPDASLVGQPSRESDPNSFQDKTDAFKRGSEVFNNEPGVFVPNSGGGEGMITSPRGYFRNRGRNPRGR